MKRLIRSAEGFWVASGTVSQSALDFIRQHLEEADNYANIGTNNVSQYSFTGVSLSMPFRELVGKFGELDTGMVDKALKRYVDYFKPLVLNRLSQEAPTQSRNPELNSIDIGVTQDGYSIYLHGNAVADNTFEPDSEYIDGTHW